jgi:hypothetical protein
MVLTILTGHAPVRTHLHTMGLFEGDTVRRVCADRRLKQHSTSFAAAKRWLARQLNVFGDSVVEPKVIRAVSQGPFPLHQKHKAAESVLKWKFRAAQ